ncbi:hypothetical protein Pelo_1044 [Pelomyxa schiedti]|nr:hypothetical protein Pelo_1044 [Pelomyxa schiedti]
MSTTGNTRYVAQTLADLWKDKPAISLITLVDITGPQRPDTTPFKTADVVGIGTLTWGLREPPRVRDFITGMDPAWVKDKPCFVFTTARVMAGNVCSNMLSALHKKNGITVGYLELLAPGNFYGLPAQGKRTVWGMDERKKIAPFAEKMHALFLSPKKHSKSGSLFSSAFSSLLLSDAQIKEMVGEVLFSSSKCVRCGLCARQCPFGAISMNESGPVWTKAKCESCSRCFNYCPKQAIVYSKLDPNFAQYRFIPGKTPVDGSFNTKEVSNS